MITLEKDSSAERQDELVLKDQQFLAVLHIFFMAWGKLHSVSIPLLCTDVIRSDTLTDAQIVTLMGQGERLRLKISSNRVS